MMSSQQVKFFRALWGAEAQFSTDINKLFAEIRRLGFTGVESTLSDIHRICTNNPDAFQRALEDNDLEFIGLVQTNYPTNKENRWQDIPVDQHVANLEQHLQEFLKYKPIHINIQGGQDSWSLEEYESFFEKALAVQAKYAPLTSSHETHRTRALYNPFITVAMLKRFPTLRLTADYSHFMLVCERLLDHPTDDERFSLFASRVDHLHSRVGTAEHPQVEDPIQTKAESDQMQKWWEMIWNAQRDRPWITITPEYGPAPYAPTPETDVWNLTIREMARQKEMYQNWTVKVQ